MYLQEVHSTTPHCYFFRMQGLFLDKLRWFSGQNSTVVRANVPVEIKVGLDSEFCWLNISVYSQTRTEELFVDDLRLK